MNLKEIHNTYFIGIGGIGMSALARYFISNGINVSGYDKTPSAITQSLEELGVQIHFTDDMTAIDTSYFDSSKTLVVYTPAIPKSHSELQYFTNNKYTVLKRSEVLGMITENTFCFAIAGTHGKTTTTSILGHLLKECGVQMTAFLGGISENYNSNLIQNGNKVSVVEADEFDRSFLTLSPDIACITSMDADHLDIYGEKDELVNSFMAFAKKVKPDGKLFTKKGLAINGITYAVDQDADYTAKNIRIKNGAYIFDMITPDKDIKDIILNLPGRHNLSNALIALAMAVEYGCAPYNLARALESYKGVKRRFTYHIKTPEFVFIDDYAHHPEEINAIRHTISEMYPAHSVLVVFQPHLYSRTRDFVDEFAQSLSQFDEIRLLEIYPARELPIKGVSSEWLLSKIHNINKKVIDKKNIVEEIKNSKCQVVLTLGAGDIGEEVKYIKDQLSIAN
jgi:UDP-N-acetylmuramate--alanine ligase